MKLTETTKRYSYGRSFLGKKKNFQVSINLKSNPMSSEQYWYFVLKKNDFSYSSLDNDLKFENQNKCVEAAERKIDELIKQNI